MLQKATGSSASKERMKTFTDNILRNGNGNGDESDVTYSKTKWKKPTKIGNIVITKIKEPGDVIGKQKQKTVSHDYRGYVLTKKKLQFTRPEEGVRTMYHEVKKKDKEKIITEKRAQRVTSRLQEKKVKQKEKIEQKIKKKVSKGKL